VSAILFRDLANLELLGNQKETCNVKVMDGMGTRKIIMQKLLSFFKEKETIAP
jgi:hypothetical protein